MKQAILITAYKNYNHLEEIINFFDANFNLYIHIDKKSKISKKELHHLLSSKTVQLVSSKYVVNWGGFNHLQSILYLVEQALKNPKNQYFHLISGHDFPIKPKSFFATFFQENNKTEYIESFSVPKLGWADNCGMDRIQYYNLYDVLNAKIYKQNRLIRKFIGLQKRLGFKRSISPKMPKLYGGSTWWSLSRDCVSYVIEFTKNNNFVLKRFKYTLCSKEFYFQTIIMNSHFGLKVVNNNLRYIDWVARNGNNPAILDMSDFEKLVTTDAFFARKFEYPLSIDLMNQIKSITK